MEEIGIKTTILKIVDGDNYMEKSLPYLLNIESGNVGRILIDCEDKNVPRDGIYRVVEGMSEEVGKNSLDFDMNISPGFDYFTKYYTLRRVSD
jgi:hypothetical protein